MTLLIVIPGTSSQILGLKIADRLNAKAIPIAFKEHPDGEIYVRIEGDVNGDHAVIVQSTCSPQNRNLLELFFLVDAAKDMGASKVTAVVPYLAYARQDKRFKKGEAINIKTVGSLLEKVGVDEVYTVDIHSKEASEQFRIPIVDLSAMPLIGKLLKDMGVENPLIVAPDDGAIHLAEKVVSTIGGEFVSFDKFRDRDTGEITMKGKTMQVEGREVAVVDDIISTGGTMAKAIEIIKSQGAKRIYAACSHPLLIGNARFRIMKAGAELIIGTDTIPSDVSCISVSTLIAEALKGR